MSLLEEWLKSYLIPMVVMKIVAKEANKVSSLTIIDVVIMTIPKFKI